MIDYHHLLSFAIGRMKTCCRSVKKNHKIPKWLIRPPGAPVNIHGLSAQLQVKFCSDFNKRLIHFSTCEVYGKTISNYLPKDSPLRQVRKWRMHGQLSRRSQFQRLVKIHGVKNPEDLLKAKETETRQSGILTAHSDNDKRLRSDLIGLGEMLASFHFLQ